MYHDMSQSLTPRHQGDSFCGPTSSVANGDIFSPTGFNFSWFQDFSLMNFLPTPDANGPTVFDPNFIHSAVAPAKPTKMPFVYGPSIATPHSRYKRDDPDIAPDERERRDRRRQRNKEAAARCRQRRLDLIDELVSRVDTFKKQNEEKHKQLEDVKKQMETVLEFFKGHMAHLSNVEKESIERATSLLDHLPGGANYDPMCDNMMMMPNLPDQTNFNGPQSTENECKFADLVPKHPMMGHFNGITGFGALPPFPDGNLMGDHMFMSFNQITGMTANGATSTADNVEQ